MKNLKSVLLVAAVLLAPLPALAGGYYPTLPAAGSVSNTYPLTGNELSAFDTQLPNGVSPQTESITTTQLATYGLSGTIAPAKAAAATNTSGFTATTSQLSGKNLVVLNLTGTLGADAAITTPTGAQFRTALTGEQVGGGWILQICNSSSANHVWTLTAAASGITISGTATIAQNACRQWLASWTNVGSTAPAITFTNIGSMSN